MALTAPKLSKWRPGSGIPRRLYRYAGPSAFTVVGTATGLTYSSQKTMVAVAGAFTVTGNAATLTYRSLAAAAGSFSVTGIAAVLTYNSTRTMAAVTASFALTGNAATLSYSGGTFGHDYSTVFGLTENPLSENGAWLGGATVGLDWADFRTTPGLAYGKQAGNSNPPYDDSIAILAGTWNQNQTVQAIVKTVNQNTSVFEELEIRLRSTCTAHSSTGYECVFSCRSDSTAYVQIVKWLGPKGAEHVGWELMGAGGGTQYALHDGDTIKASVTGSSNAVVTMWINGTQVLQITDNGALGGAAYTTGNPGIGAYLQSIVGVNSDYGFKSLIATDNGQIAANLTAASVQAALNAAATGQIVHLPAGTATWTTQVTWTAPSNVTLRGQGWNSGTRGGGDATVIIDGLVRGADSATFQITSPSSGKFRLSGITFRGNGNSNTFTDNGVVRIGGSCTQVIMDHLHWDSIRRQPWTSDGPLGVAFECLYDMTDGTADNAARPQGSFVLFGDTEWSNPTNFGGSNFFFHEDCTFNHGLVNDSVQGARQVWRYNAFNFTAVQTHPTGSQNRLRGSRAMEIYNNTFTGGGTGPTGTFNCIFFSAGCLLVYNNTCGNLYQNFLTLHSMRRDNSTYSQTATPNGWGYSGKSFNGTGSNWDQNTSATTGYRPMDQPGNGQGDLLSLDFPNAKNNTSGIISWPNQALEPIYEWGNTWTGSGGGSYWAVYNTDVLTADTNYYLYTASFNGTTGVGTGTLASRPSSGLTTGVGYWATDTNTLYTATGSTTWATYYTPYTYPHPLRN